MIEHLIFLTYVLIFLHSILGYGFILNKIINLNSNVLNLGYSGLNGFFLITLVSIVSSFFFEHSKIHNLIIHLIGLFFFLKYFKNNNKFSDIKLLWLITSILWISLYIFKNHDDFPYYHLTYALNLSENSFVIGAGNFGHGYRTFSSLFYFHSILFMPFIDFYLFHSGPFFILVFFNIIILLVLKNSYTINKVNFLYFFCLLSFIFINIAFYRIGEHGTDRSAQILLVIIFYLFFDLLYFNKIQKFIIPKLKLILIIIILASSFKAIYYLYLILIPIIIFKKKLIDFFLIKKNTLFIFLITLNFLLNVSINYFNTGCLLYPAKSTCIIEQPWSISKKEVERMSVHYEWWSKAGGGPGYEVDIKPREYIKNFNWLDNWIDRHFFNKVSDTLIGILFIAVVVYFVFRYFSKTSNKRYKKKTINLKVLFIPIIFLIEWFLNHPSMRYGGYILFTIPIFIFTSIYIEKLILRKKDIKNVTIFFLILTLLIFNVRNVKRINYEVKNYNYNLFKNPYFFVKNVESDLLIEKYNYKIFNPKSKQKCWASQTPCSYREKLDVKKFLWFKIIINTG